jgi:ankyrin repeat protein
VAKWTQFTPLHTAAYFDNAALITLLLTKARPNAAAKCAQFEGATPLHLAAMAGNLAAATALLRHGAPADAKDDHLRTPLDCAKLTATSQQQQQHLEGGADETPEEREFRLSFTPIINLVGTFF